MTGFLEDSVLRFMGLDDAEIAKLNERLPDIQNLISVWTAHKDQIHRVSTDCGPIFNKIIQKQRELK